MREKRASKASSRGKQEDLKQELSEVKNKETELLNNILRIEDRIAKRFGDKSMEQEPEATSQTEEQSESGVSGSGEGSDAQLSKQESLKNSVPKETDEDRLDQTKDAVTTELFKKIMAESLNN